MFLAHLCEAAGDRTRRERACAWCALRGFPDEQAGPGLVGVDAEGVHGREAANAGREPAPHLGEMSALPGLRYVLVGGRSP